MPPLLDKFRKWLAGPPKTVAYSPMPIGMWGQAPRDLPYFTFMTIHMMLWDPTVRLGLAMREAPLINAEFAHKEGDKWVPGVEADSPELAAFVEAELDRFWRHDVIKLLKSQVWGWAAGESVYKINREGLIEGNGLLTRRAEDVRALESDGQLIGVRFRRGSLQSGSVDLLRPKSLWHAYMPEDGNHYGMSVLRGCYSPWCDKWLDGMALDVRRLFMHKDAYGGADMGYPPGTTNIDGKGEVPNRDIAREVVEQMKAGAVTTRPSVYVDGKELWPLTRAVVPANPQHILQYPKDLDVEILRGMEVPDDILTSENDQGAWAGKAIPQQAFYTGLDKWLNVLVADIVRQRIEPIVALDWGRDRYFQVRTKPLAIQASEQSGGNRPQSQQGNPNQSFGGWGGPQQSPGFNQGDNDDPMRMSLSERLVGDGVVDACDIVQHAREVIDAKVRRMAAVHAPHNMTVAGKQFRGGEFIPGKVLAKASPEEKAALGKVAANGAKKNGSPTKPVNRIAGLKINRSTARAFNGEPVALKTKISKQESGRIGEWIVLSWLRGHGFSDAGPMNTKLNNFPIDLFHDHATVEIKTGLVSNSRDAQKWRLTIGEPGKQEKEWLATASPEEKAKWNARKQELIHQRKEKVLNELSKEFGKPIKPKTITVLLNPDTKTADIYEFDGWHDRISWNSDQAKAGYKGSVNYA